MHYDRPKISQEEEEEEEKKKKKKMMMMRYNLGLHMRGVL